MFCQRYATSALLLSIMHYPLSREKSLLRETPFHCCSVFVSFRHHCPPGTGRTYFFGWSLSLETFSSNPKVSYGSDKDESLWSRPISLLSSSCCRDNMSDMDWELARSNMDDIASNFTASEGVIIAPPDVTVTGRKREKPSVMDSKKKYCTQKWFHLLWTRVLSPRLRNYSIACACCVF